MKFILNKEKWKLNENLSAARKILKDNSIPETDETFVKLRSDLKNNTGYLGWFTKMIYVNKVGRDINQILNLIHNDKYVIDNLPKNLIKYTNWENLMDDIISVQYNRSIKKMINELPSHLKSKIDIEKMSSEDKNLYATLFKREDKDLFLNKVSRYRTRKDFINALKLFLSGDGAKNFDGTLKLINDVKSPIVHQDKENNLIICEVNYRQIKRLGSDTSWCIVPSESTFDRYVEGVYKQYIIFLTDLTSVYSKIGVTAAFDTKNIHLKDDKYLDKRDLVKLLADRDYDIKNMLFNVHDFLSTRDINQIDVKTLVSDCKMSLDDICKRKTVFTKNDVYNLQSYSGDDKILKKYGIENKMEIKSYNEFKKLYKNSDHLASDFVDNIDRLKFTISFKELIELRPMPRYLEKFKKIVYGEYDRPNKYLDLLISVINSTELFLEKFNNFKSYYNTWKDYSGDHKYSDEYGSEFLIYAMMVAGVYPYTVDKEELLSKDLSFKLTRHTMALVRHLQLNGYKFTDEELFNIFKNLRPLSSFGTVAQEWTKVLQEYPSISKYVKDIIIKGISHISFYESELDVIHDVYPDLYEEAKTNSKIFGEYANFKRLTIYSNYQNAKDYIKNALVKDSITLDEWLNNFYNKFFGEGVLKNYTKFINEEVYLIIVVLTKLNKLDELQDFKLNWGSFGFNSSSLTYIIRFCCDYSTDRLPISAPELNLTRKDKNDILDTLVKLDYNFDDMMTKHRSFAVPYYIKDWGFPTFMRMVKNKTDKVERHYHEDGETKIEMVDNIRIKYILELLKYLIMKNKVNEAIDIVDEIMEWDMSEYERKESIKYLYDSYDLYSIDGTGLEEWRRRIKILYPRK